MTSGQGNTSTCSGNGKMAKMEWTAEKRQFLRDSHRRMTNAELAYQLGATVWAVERELSALGLRRHKRWTPEREQFLRDNYETMTNASLARELGITQSAASKKLSRLGLVRKEP